MHPNPTVRIGTGQLASDLQSVRNHLAAANESPSVSTLLAVASDTPSLVVDVQNLSRDKNRLLIAAHAVVQALHDGRPDGPMADLAALLGEFGAPAPVLVSP